MLLPLPITRLAEWINDRKGIEQRAQPPCFSLARINCPEMKTAEGKAAKAWVLSYITSCKMAGATFHLMSSKHGKYRWLADVIVNMPNGDIFHLNDEIVKANHGKYAK